MDPTPDDGEGVQGPRKNRRKPTVPYLPGVGTDFANQIFKIESRESRAEVAARLNNERTKLEHDLRKDSDLFRVVMGIVILAILVCIFIVLSNRYPPTIQNAAMALLAAIVSGGVGYATGKSSK